MIENRDDDNNYPWLGSSSQSLPISNINRQTQIKRISVEIYPDQCTVGQQARADTKLHIRRSEQIIWGRSPHTWTKGSQASGLIIITPRLLQTSHLLIL